MKNCSVRKGLQEALRKHRRLRGDSQARVAERLGASQQIVSRIERGQASLEQVVKLCKAMGLRLAIEIGETRLTLVHPIDPEERRQIEANIDWFQRIEPGRRLRVIARHVKAALRLQRAACHGK
jgi:transcriptional regulator with XRE-family HTH domain